jgi:glutathione S-transferase
MLELYHRTDAICAMKVRMALAEKGLPWESRLVEDLRSPEYLRLNPNGYVPTLVHDGRVLTESRIISEYLEDAFPDPALMPSDPFERFRARWWSKQIDDTLHLNIFMLTFVARGGWGLASVSEEARQRRLPKDPVKRDITVEMIRDGMDTRWISVALERFSQLIGDMEEALEQGPWLAGGGYSLADIDLTAYLHRLDQMGLALLWDDRRAVRDWYDRVRARPSFDKGVSDWLTAEDLGAYGQHLGVVTGAARAWLAA